MPLIERIRGSLRGRLAIGLALGIAAVLGLSFFTLHGVVRGALYTRFDEDLLNRMRAIAAYAIEHPGRRSVAELMPRFESRAHQDYFQIRDARGETLARSASSGGRDLPKVPATIDRPVFRDVELPDGHRGRAVAQVFELPPGDPRGTLHVVTAEEVESLEALEHRIHLVLLAVAIATALAATVIAWLIVVRSLRPLQDFSRSLERVDLDDPHARLETGALPGELRPLADRFHLLLERLLGALARERRYARNVAHELRNPVAEMRLLAEVGAGAGSLEEARGTIGEIHAATAELQQVIESLLALTRYEAGIEQPQLEPVELRGLLRAQVDALRAAAALRDTTLAATLPHETWVHTDAALLRRLIANLLGNAVAHAPRGSALAVTLSQAAVLRISNPAPHLAATDLPRLGEHFYRVGAGDGGPHAGLGLALATAIARVLDLRLDFALDEDGELVVEVSGFRPLEPTPS